MACIGIIAPDQKIYDDIIRLALELGINEQVSMHLATLEAGVAVAKALERNEVDVIVSRGVTVEMIRASGISTPLVTIPLSIEDFATAFNEAKIITGLARPRVGAISYIHTDRDLKSFASLLDIDLRVSLAEGNKDGVVAAVEQVVSWGIDVLVGSYTARSIAEKYAIPTILHESGDMSLRQALLEAKGIAYARRLEQAHTENLRAIVESSRDGIFTLNSSGLIQTANPAAVHMLQLAVVPREQPIESILPLPGIMHTLQTGTPIADELVQVGSLFLLVNVIPIIIRHSVTGAVVSFQKTQSIRDMETKIRRSLYTKGMVAKHTFRSMLGVSPQLQQAIKTAVTFAATDETVFITGETGTGKEVFAQAIHNASSRSKGPFVAVNCAALPPSLLESELFGYEEGAFTGANRKGKPGLFELAHKGTIFLDEITDMDHYGQTRLLRTLQEHATMRLGGDRYTTIDIRVIAATNTKPAEMVRQGKFREDLFYRLYVLPLQLPALRERKGDVAELATRFAALYKKGNKTFSFTPEALGCLQTHTWPGNIRELQNCVKRIALTCTAPEANRAEVAALLQDTVTRFSSENEQRGCTAQHPCLPPATSAAKAEETEQQHIIQALRNCGGRQNKAAALLGIHPTTLYRKMRRWGIRK